MARTGTAQYQHLESLDSCRVLRPRPGEPAGKYAGKYAEEAHLQVFTEVLLTLALGRTVVVPQSYAFDSYAFLRTAEDQRAARAALDAHLNRVAGTIGGRVGVSARSGSLIEMVLTAAGAAGPAPATEAWHLPGPLSHSASAASAVGSPVYGRTKQAVAGRRRTRRTACALGRVVDVRG
ncbi:hypothetical protein ACFY00_22705 [Kitasatospora sp. NPDC001540]|uniref:hypothetical protein n=1 Tax=Kitasatospora sp. NPDC001540 TaxID=3364014 RepID=UPI0036C08B76